MTKVTIIGFGNLGSHLFYALKKSGKYSINYTVKNSKVKINKEKINQSDIIFITTQDSKIKKVVNQLKGKSINLRNKFVFHTSGALASDILYPLRPGGCYAGSFHPVQTFQSPAKNYSRLFENIFIAAEGDQLALKKATYIIKSIRAKPLILSKENKILHHICCVIASNYLVTLIRHITNFKKILKNGFKNRRFFSIYEPLTSQTLKNIKSRGILNSLTGPVERNDKETIKLHLRTLEKKMPSLLNFYSYLGIETAELALQKGSLNKKSFLAITNLFKKYL
ncbi:MAG: Rossmann-like and DUF2520 domain-containing protein [Ignavibacteria bacterium]